MFISKAEREWKEEKKGAEWGQTNCWFVPQTPKTIGAGLKAGAGNAIQGARDSTTGVLIATS